MARKKKLENESVVAKGLIIFHPKMRMDGVSGQLPKILNIAMLDALVKMGFDPALPLRGMASFVTPDAVGCTSAGGVAEWLLGLGFGRRKAVETWTEEVVTAAGQKSVTAAKLRLIAETGGWIANRFVDDGSRSSARSSSPVDAR